MRPNEKELYIEELEENEEISELPESLKKIFIFRCHHLTQLPISSSSFSELEEFNISNCKKLTEIPSLLDCNQLKKLNLHFLGSLELIPEVPTSLVEFFIENCPKLEIFPESLLHCTNLEQFKIRNCKNIKEINNLPKSLKEIDIDKCDNLEVLQSLSDFANLKQFKISNCEKITEINNLPNSIESLVLISNCPNLSTLPQSLSDCTRLNHVTINNCNKITEINNLPKSLKSFYSNGCQNITTLQSLSDFTKLKTFGIVDCDKITEINNLPTSIEELDIENCTNLTTLQSLSDFPELKTLIIRQCENLQTPLNGLQDCSNLQHFDIRDREITEIPEITHLTKLKNLKFSGCANLTTLPDLSNLTNLQELRLDGCSRLVFTPELIQKLSALEEVGCSIIYPRHFESSDLTKQYIDRLGKVTEEYNRNKSKNEPNLENITTFFSRFLTEGISQRTKQTDSNIKKANKIAKSTESFLKFIEENPQHLPWIDEVSKNYLAGCINQPVWGFFEISALTQMAKEEKFSDKVILAKALVAIQGITEIIAEENKKLLREGVGARASVEVEAGNTLLINLHDKLLEKEIITKPWPGVPERIAYEETVKTWCDEHHIKDALKNLVDRIEGYKQEGCIDFLCKNSYVYIWQPIAFPNNKDIEEIKDRYNNMSHEDAIAFGGKREGEIMDKVMELTRDKISNQEMQKSNGEQGEASDSTRPHSTPRPSSTTQVLENLPRVPS